MTETTNTAIMRLTEGLASLYARKDGLKSEWDQHQDALIRLITLLVERLDSEYDLENAIGIGGNSIVFSCTHRTLGFRAVLKVPRLSMHKLTSLISNLDREIQLFRRLHHPSIARLHNYGIIAVDIKGTSYNLPFVVIEYAAGGSLAEYIQSLASS